MHFWRQIFQTLTIVVIAVWSLLGIGSAVLLVDQVGPGVVVIVAGALFLGILNAAGFGFCYAVLDGLGRLVELAEDDEDDDEEPLPRRRLRPRTGFVPPRV